MSFRYYPFKLCWIFLNLIYLIRRSDISHRARNLLSKWSRMFARRQAMKKHNGTKSSTDEQNELILKQRQVLLLLIPAISLK